MRKIVVRIVSPSNEPPEELPEIRRFFHRLNDVCLDRGVYFSLVTDEAAPGADGCAADTPDSDRIAFFLFPRSAGRHALDAYLNAARRLGNDGLIAYVKADAGPPAAETARLTAELSRETGRYCYTYAHVDTLLLGMLIQLRRFGPDGADIRLQDGRAWLGGTALLELNRVEMVLGHEALRRLKAELTRLDGEFSRAKAAFIENPDDGDAYEVFCDASLRRSGVLKEIQDIETSLYRLIAFLYEQMSRGEMSPRQAQGYLLMERGQYGDAKAVLEFSDLACDGRQADALADRAAKSAQTHVNELLQLKEMNEALADWQGVDACFREAVRLEERHGLPGRAMLAYTQFLFRQNRQQESVKLAERLLYACRNPAAPAPDAEMARLYKLLGQIYNQMQRLEDAEKMYESAVGILSAPGGRGTDSADLVDCYNQLGALLNDMQRFGEAEAVYCAARELLKKLAIINPDVYEPFLAKNLHSLGNLYREMRRLEEAESAYVAALDLGKRLAGRSPDVFESELARMYGNLADLYYDAERMAESEAMHKPALEIRRRLAERNPDAFEPALSESYHNLGMLYWVTERHDEAEAMYKAALDLKKRLHGRSPEAFEKTLANSHNGLGVVYYSQKRFDEAEQAFKASLDIRLRLAERHPDAFELVVSDCYSNLGSVYQEVDRFSEAETMFRSAQKIIQRKAAGDPEAFEPDLADNLFNQGNLYKAMQRVAEAENAGRTALRLYTRYADTNPYCAKMAGESRKLLESLYELQESRLKDTLLAGGDVPFTPEEREIALLLTEGETQRDIARKLRLTAAEVSRHVNVIRDKMIVAGDPDAALAAIVHSFRLSRREAHILRCLRRNMANPGIAAELFIAEETVRVHIHKLLKKLPVESRQDIAAWVEAYGAKQE